MNEEEKNRIIDTCNDYLFFYHPRQEHHRVADFLTKPVIEVMEERYLSKRNLDESIATLMILYNSDNCIFNALKEAEYTFGSDVVQVSRVRSPDYKIPEEMKMRLINEFGVVITNGQYIYQSINEKNSECFAEGPVGNTARKLICRAKQENRVSALEEKSTLLEEKSNVLEDKLSLLEAKLDTIHDMLSMLVGSETGDGDGMINIF